VLATVSMFGQTLPGFDNDRNDALLLTQNSASQPSIETSAPPQKSTIATVRAEPKPTPSQNVTINLIHRLVERGVLTKSDADELIKQAEADAAAAREMAVKQTRPQSQPDNELASQYFAEPTPIPSSASTTSAAPPSSAPEPNPPAEGDDAVTVSYVPDVVKEQLREEIKQEVMQQARDENWANPRVFPPWVLRLTPFFDFRVRYEGDFYPDGNDGTGAFPNFNAINTGPPFDTTGTTFSPQLNADKDRERFRIRVRAGAQMDLQSGFTAGLRLATGETDTPVSPNQSLGVANNAQGGNFSKYAIWLDRAFVRYEQGGTPAQDFQVNVGRFDNPFFTTSGIVWYEDLGFDGLALSGRYRVRDWLTPFATLGGFPIFNTDFNFATNRPDKFSSEDKFLLAAQGGTVLRFNKDFSAKVAGAYYDFESVEGKLSDPCDPLTPSDQCNTDDTRPSFAQNGNTYFPLRNITPTIDNGFGTKDQFQYFGLASPFHVFDFTGAVDYSRFDPLHLQIYGEYIDNVAFDWQSVNARAINNRGPNLPNGKLGPFIGGNTGWIAGIKVGTPAFQKPGDWYVGVNYRYVESDATIDGFVDSDFAANFAGTNLKGYTIFGSLALTPRTSLFLRFMSADAVGGPTFRNDVLQFDFNARF